MGKPEVCFDSYYSAFDPDDVCASIDWKDSNSKKLRLYAAPKIAWKMSVSGYSPDRISISKNKDFPEKDTERPDEDMLRDLHKQFLQAGKCLYLYLDANAVPLFFGDKTAMIAIEKDFYNSLPELSLEILCDFINDLEKNIKTTYFIGPRDSVYHVRKTSIGKLFYPFMIDWIEDVYPTFREPGDAAQFITDSGLRILLSYFIALHSKSIIPLGLCALPENYLFVVSLDGYMSSPFGVDGLPNDLTRDFTKMMPRLSGDGQRVITIPPANSSSTIESNAVIGSSVIPDEALTEIVKSRMSNPKHPFYTGGVITETNIKDSLDEFVSMSWTSFLSCIEQVKVGCSIFMAPGEVVLDDVGHIIFSEQDFPLIHYHGPNNELAYKRNSIDVIYTGSKINEQTLSNLRELFKRMFNVKIQSVTPVTTSAD